MPTARPECLGGNIQVYNILRARKQLSNDVAMHNLNRFFIHAKKKCTFNITSKSCSYTVTFLSRQVDTCLVRGVRTRKYTTDLKDSLTLFGDPVPRAPRRQVNKLARVLLSSFEEALSEHDDQKHETLLETL